MKDQKKQMEQTKQEMQSTSQEPEEQQEEVETPEAVSVQARERGAIVLEVLAGAMQVQEASERLSINPPAYYNLETRAVQGLIQACEPRGKGPGENLRKKIRDLEQEITHLEREARRYQSLTRAAQKAIGLQMSIDPKSNQENSTGKKKKPKPRKARGLRRAERLRGTRTVKSLKAADVKQ